MIRGSLRIDDDRATDRVAAVQSSLGTLEDLDLVEVEQSHVELLLIVLRDPINDHRDRRIGVRDLSEATNDDEAVPIGIGTVERHIRHVRHEVRGVFDSRVTDPLGGEHVDLNRHVLEPLASLLGSHDHLLERVFGHRGYRTDESRCDGESQLDGCSHGFSSRVARLPRCGD